MGHFSSHNKDVYERNVHHYAHADYIREDEDTLVKKFFTQKGAPTLVAGVGGGRIIPLFLSAGLVVTAVDISHNMVEETRKRYGAQVTVEEMNIQHTSFADATFEYIFLPFHTVCYVDDFEATMRELHRIVRPGGVVIINAVNYLFIRSILNGNVFKGKRRLVPILRATGSDAVWTQHLDIFDIARLKKIFAKVAFYSRSNLQQHPPENWKDRIVRAIPALDKSIYFVCTK